MYWSGGGREWGTRAEVVHCGRLVNKVFFFRLVLERQRPGAAVPRTKTRSDPETAVSISDANQVVRRVEARLTRSGSTAMPQNHHVFANVSPQRTIPQPALSTLRSHRRPEKTGDPPPGGICMGCGRGCGDRLISRTAQHDRLGGLALPPLLTFPRAKQAGATD